MYTRGVAYDTFNPKATHSYTSIRCEDNNNNPPKGTGLSL